MSDCLDVREIELGDFVDVEFGVVGEVVFNSHSGSFSEDFPKAEWDYMEEKGFMIRQDDGALIFYAVECIDPQTCPVVRLTGPKD